MKLRKSLLRRSQLYLILDKPSFAGCSLESLCSKISRSGVGLIQLRDKVSAKADVLSLAIKLAKCLDKSKTLFIVNDYLDVAVLSKADGLHLGQADLPLKKARSILGKDKIIGVSCHNLRQALEAQREGADYIGIGPVYATATKPEYSPVGLKVLKQLKGKIKIPYFAIGNIGKNNIKKIVACGSTRIAVCRAISESRCPEHAAKELLMVLPK
ncbi:thiamine phosphate synthase [bacterium]|nr:MAG: thiamine phosphate synthase [bacterium]